MVWKRADAAAAIAAILEQVDTMTVIGAPVSVFAAPPETFNPPAYIVGYPAQVNYDGATFGIDEALLPVYAVGGMSEVDRIDALLEAAKVALAADTTAGGAVQWLRVTTQTNWRPLKVGGSDLLAGDLTIEIRM
jgi:hypothetical protein